ncbi:MAG: hypothetical protein QOG90_498 [Actinomycetota bacterium]
MKLWRWGVVVVLLLGVLPRAAHAVFPYGAQPGSVYDYSRLHINHGTCAGVATGQPRPVGSDLPANFDCRGTWKLSDYASVPGDDDYDPAVNLNPQEFFGVRGPGTNRAWETTTGRPDTVIAVTDSGIRWDEDRPELMKKFALNRGELPKPNGGGRGGSVADYDADGDGVFTVADYAHDAHVHENPYDENKIIDPGDIIRAFSDGKDDDNNGYVDDISGWDFFEGDNDPNDDVDYSHGTGESEDSAGETGTKLDPQCPNCTLMEMRVGDSFVADSNHFAEAAVYATDNGASVIQSALGALNHTGFAQKAVDYAYDHGVLFVASAADESAGHHNQPSALNHAMVVNSVTHAVDQVQHPATWLAFNGCTNFGGYIWVSVASSSCSSDAVAQSAGMAGLVYSAARNAVQKGVIQPDASGKPISAEEAKQLFRLAAQDIDFSTPKPPGPPNNFATSLPATTRFVTTAGWDQISGWGRIRSDDLVRLVAAGHIPPEADISSPRWWEPLAAKGSVKVTGRVAAPRADHFTWEVQYAPGVQPPRWPATETWTTVKHASASAPVAGTLATINLAEVRAAIDSAVPPYTRADDPTARSLPEKDAFRVRVVVKTGDQPWQTAIAQHQAFAHDDPGLVAGWPRFLDGDGAGSPAFEDLDNDGRDELMMGDGNGYVHAYKADGSEAAGWPVHTRPIALRSSGKNGFTRGDVPKTVYAAILTGAPVVADVDGDGAPEVGVADIEGDLHLWHHDGTSVHGFPVRGNRAYSYETSCNVVLHARCDDDGPADARDHLNTVGRAFTSQPAAADLDRAVPGLELIAGSNDGHVYAWHADGSPVAGWPVLLRDPTKVKAVDPVTHRVTYNDNAGAHFGRKVLATPSVGDVDGDGNLEVAVNVNEEYEETPNTVDPVAQVVSAVVTPGNTRTYLLHHDGTAHPQTAATAATPNPDDQAYVAGWPVAIAMLDLELLPYVGEGSNGTPTMADVDGDGKFEIGTASIGGPAYLLNRDGSSHYGARNGKYVTAATTQPGPGSTASDLPSVASLGGGVFGRVGSNRVDFAMGATGTRRLLDVVIPEQQLLAEDHLSMWNSSSGAFDPGFPAQMNDLQFINTPVILDVNGDGKAEVLQASAMYDLAAYGANGLPVAGFPKFTGGWAVASAGAGDMDGDGKLELALATRDGNLFLWRTGGNVCQANEWPKNGHDLRNTGAYGTDADRPGTPSITSVTPADGGVVVSFTPTGDDGKCGAARTYRVSAGGASVDVPAGTSTVHLASIGGATKVFVRAIDESGNVGFAATYALPTGVLPRTGGGDEAKTVAIVVVALALVVRRVMRHA